MTLTDTVREETLVAAMLSIRLPDETGLRPLTQSEFRLTADCLQREGYGLPDVLRLPDHTLTSLLHHKPQLSDKVLVLRQRVPDVKAALQNWAADGIWVLGETDPAYPRRLVKRLVASRPPLLFGCGPNESLNAGGICIVGSRNSSEDAIGFARTLAERCAAEQLTIISSDMRGVDRAAVHSATENGGRAIMVLSDKLEKAIAHPRFASALAEHTITMVTPFAPHVGFSVGNAVRANRYQYALSDLAVIAETRRKGGIWQGAEENRKGNWVPAFVRSGNEMPPGNRALLHLGLAPITHQQISDAESVSQLFLDRRKASTSRISPTGQSGSAEMPSLYQIFLRELLQFAQRARSLDDIAAHFDITTDQAVTWLDRAAVGGAIQRSQGETDTRVVRLPD